MKKGGGILAILSGGKPSKAKPESDIDDEYEDDDLDEEVDPLDDMDDEDEGDESGERREVCDRLFDAFESRDHAGLWAALGDAVDMMRGG